MSLELKVVLLTVALVAYLVIFNIHPCWRSDCCGLVANLTETNGTLRWGPKHPQSHRRSPVCSVGGHVKPCCACLCSPIWTGHPGGLGWQVARWSQVYTQS